MVWRIGRAVHRVAVLAGGNSAERDISRQSGTHVAAALREAGDRVEIFDPAEIPLAQIPWKHFDVCFNALHGGAGEDGRLQRRLDLLKVPYTGSDMAASRLAMSKSASKERFLQAGLPTLPYLLFQSDESADQLEPHIASLGYPAVIKPDSQGSSLGVGCARHGSDLESCLAECRRYDDFAIAEPLIVGRELTVSVLGRRPLPLLEVIPPAGMFDYAAKYGSDRTQYRFDTGLPSSLVDDIRQTAVQAAECLGTSGLVRVDIMLDSKNRWWVLEVNTVPGLTSHSLAPKAAAQAGMGMAELCHWMIQDCLGIEVLP